MTQVPHLWQNRLPRPHALQPRLLRGLRCCLVLAALLWGAQPLAAQSAPAETGTEAALSEERTASPAAGSAPAGSPAGLTSTDTAGGTAATADTASGAPEAASPDSEQTDATPDPAATPDPTAASLDTQPEKGSQGLDKSGQPHWRQLEPGLTFGEFQLNDSEARLTALRIDPEHFFFCLYSRSQDGGALRTLGQWGRQYGLTAAINASMYLPDGSTSTGYMRQGQHCNNKRLVQRFGAFFVAGPRRPQLPQAAIVDRDQPGWQALLDEYETVIQNYRMINAERRILWSPGGPHYSISAVAQDGEGQILFLHCRQPVEAYAFAQQLLHLPLNIRTVMYVEGGAQAGLLIHSQALRKELGGQHPVSFVTGNIKAKLPNVLGVSRRRAAAPQEQGLSSQTVEPAGSSSSASLPSSANSASPASPATPASPAEEPAPAPAQDAQGRAASPASIAPPAAPPAAPAPAATAPAAPGTALP